jgi:hypothetical protein
VLKKVLRQVESKGDEMLQGLDEQEVTVPTQATGAAQATQAAHAPHPTRTTRTTGATPRKRPFALDEAIDDTSDETLGLTTKMDIDSGDPATDNPAKSVPAAPEARRQTRANTLKDTEKKTTASESLINTEKKTAASESSKVTEKKTATAKGKGKKKEPADEEEEDIEEERVSDPDTIHCKPRPARETAEEKLDSVLKKHGEAVKVGGSRKSGVEVGGKAKKGGVGKK